MADERTHDEESTYTKTDRRVAHEGSAEDAQQAQDADDSQQEAPTPEDSIPPQQPAQADEAPQQAPDTESPPEAAGEAPVEEPGPEPPDLSEVGVFGILRLSVSLLSQHAWIALGVQAPPGGDTRQDLPEAKIGIDALVDIIEHLQPDLDDAEKRELDNLVANLRINYIQRAG